ncbi:hypothetical protein FNF28_02320 [Cafeteria roenbergensis]|uniref:Uncharacterized protein n=1 Tax=Cafeteria roenbergensis TaxID=33653 RepID=A0A5A8DTJ5_CAFRO|nr:hypothetical protein FNF28_02320 [Cafeteria roenbergensis]
MALIEPRVAQGLAAAAGVESVDTFAASVISSELESRVRQIVSEAVDVQRHTLEPRLTGAHVMAALKQHALPFRVRRPRGAPAASFVGVRHSAGEGLFAARTATVSLADAMEEGLPAAQAGPSLYAHWLLVRGEQPDVPENPSLPAPAAADSAAPGAAPGAQSSTDGVDESIAAVQTLKPRAAAVLTHEQQQYLNVVTMALLQPDTVVWRGVLTSLAADKGLAILVPHLVRVAGATVSRFVSVPARASAAAELLEALARNADASTLSLYLHHAVPHRSLLPRAVAVMERQMQTGLQSLEALEANGGIKGSSGDDVSADVATDVAMLFGALTTLSKLGSAVRETVLQPHAGRLLALVEAVAPADARPFSGCNALWTDLFLQRCRAVLDPAAAGGTARSGPVA